MKSFLESHWERYPEVFGASEAIAKLAGPQARLTLGVDLARVVRASGLTGPDSAFAKLADQLRPPGLEKALADLTAPIKAATELNAAALKVAGASRAMGLAVASTQAIAFIDAIDRQRALLLDLARRIGVVGISLLPPNWKDVGFPENLEELLLDEGLPLAWVPPQEILEKLLAASTPGQRRQVISSNRKRLTQACIDELQAIDLKVKARQVWVDDFALEAAYALREGRWRASQALSANLVDSVLRSAIDASVTAEVKDQKKRFEWDSYEVKSALVFGALYGIYAHYFPSSGDPVPRKLSRHATAHVVSPQQYLPINALLALMHVVGLLRLVEEAGKPVKPSKRAKKLSQGR
jgi:hypothetical protein